MVLLAGFIVLIAALTVRVGYIQLARGDYLTRLADDLHYRERTLYAKRGDILDRNGVVLATSASVCSISVIHNQVEDSQAVAKLLSEELSLDYEDVLKKVEKKVALQTIKTRVEPEVAGEDPSGGPGGNSDRRKFQTVLSFRKSGVSDDWFCRHRQSGNYWIGGYLQFLFAGN